MIATNNEDRVFEEKTQRGTGAAGYLPGPYGTIEGDVDSFINWYIERLGISPR